MTVNIIPTEVFTSVKICCAKIAGFGDLGPW